MTRSLLLVSLAACTVPPLDSARKQCLAGEECTGGLTCLPVGECGTPPARCVQPVPACGADAGPCEALLVEAPVEDFHWRYVDDGYSAVWTRGDKVVYRRWNTQLVPTTYELTVSAPDAGRSHWPWLAVAEGAVVISWVEEGDAGTQQLQWTMLALDGGVLAAPAPLTLMTTRQSPRVAWNREIDQSAVAWIEDDGTPQLHGVSLRPDGGIVQPAMPLPGHGRTIDSFDFSEHFTLGPDVAGWLSISGGHDTSGRKTVEFFYFKPNFVTQITSTDVDGGTLPSLAHAVEHRQHWCSWVIDRTVAGRSSYGGSGAFDVYALDAGSVVATGTFAGPRNSTRKIPLLFSSLQSDGVGRVIHGESSTDMDDDPTPFSPEWQGAMLPGSAPEVAMGPDFWAIDWAADGGAGAVVKTEVHCAH